jgi:hypothetical protein
MAIEIGKPICPSNFDHDGPWASAMVQYNLSIKNIIGNHLYILIREIILCKGNSLFWLEKL